MDGKRGSGERAFSFVKQFDYIREAGTSGEVTAAKALSDTICSLGLAPIAEEFSFPENEIQSAALQVLAPYRKSYTVKGCRYSGQTGEEGLAAPFYYAEDADAVSLSKAAGKIVLINGKVGKTLYKRLKEAGALAFLSISGTPLDIGEDRMPEETDLRWVKDACLPGLCVHYLDAAELVERGAREIQICLRQASTVCRSQNIAVRIPGVRFPEQILALTAHYDSVAAGPGAYDNMAGVSIVMEACRYFAKHPPAHTVECVFFGAEEKGLQGSRAYLARRQQKLSDYLLNLNVDLAGQTIGGTVLGVTADIGLCDMLEKLLWKGRIGARIRHKVWESDSNSFAANGIPALTLDRDGFGMHTRHDTADLLSPWALGQETQLLLFLVTEFDAMENMPFPREIPEEMQRELQRGTSE